MNDTTTNDRALTFHNRCICADTRNGIREDDLIALLPRCTLDDCDNITHIDGRRVVYTPCIYRLAE